MNPKISIILPVYNLEKYIEQCIESILNQTLKDFELIIIDDGSTDLSKKIINKYYELNNNIIFLKQNNSGVSVARNYALKNAKGEYIFYMDGDDYLERTCLEILYNKAKESNADIVIYAHKEFYDDKNKKNNIIDLIGNGIDVYKIYNGEQVSDMVLNCRFLGTPWNKLFKREKLISNNFTFEEGRYVQDWYPIFVQIYKSNIIAFINKPLYNYRIRKTSTTAQKTKKNIDDYNYAVNNILKYSIKNNLNYNSILTFKLISLNIIILRYYNLNKNKNLYKNFKNTEYYKNIISIYQALKVKNVSIKSKLNIILWNLRIYHLMISAENVLRRIIKQ